MPKAIQTGLTQNRSFLFPDVDARAIVTAGALITLAGQSAPRTYTLPDADCGVLTDHAVITVAQGGSGASSFTAHGVLLGNSSGAFGVTAVGADGTVMIGHTGADPTFSASPTLTSVTAGSLLGSAASNLLVQSGTSQNVVINALGGSIGFQSNGSLQAFLNSGSFGVTTALVVGTNPAAAGGIRLTNGTGGYIQARNFGNSADLFVIGVGVDNNLYLGGGTFASPGFRSGNGDNLDDVGAATTRWRTSYLGTAVVVGTNPATVGEIRTGNGGRWFARNAANSADILVVGYGTSFADTVSFGQSGFKGVVAWDLLQFVGQSSSFPALKRSAATLSVRLADDSGDAGFVAGSVSATVGLSTVGGGYVNWSGRSVMRSPVDGQVTLLDSTETTFTRLNFGGTTASFPTLKRNGVGIDVRLADDSGYGNVTASGVFAAAAFFGPGTYATTGDVRLRHTAQINGRDSTNATDVILLDWGGTTDTLTVGQAGFDTVVHGKINLSPGANDIKWGKALVALGTTSLITLGKTGGSGPATVAQDSWMRVLDSTGAAFFVPVWK